MPSGTRQDYGQRGPRPRRHGDQIFQVEVSRRTNTAAGRCWIPLGPSTDAQQAPVLLWRRTDLSLLQGMPCQDPRLPTAIERLKSTLLPRWARSRSNGCRAARRSGSPFEFDVDVLSPTGDIPTAKVLGKSFSVALSQGEPPPRWFNGIVTRLAQVAWTGSTLPLSREVAADAVDDDEGVELPHLPEHHDPRSHHGAARRARCDRQEAPRIRQVSQVGIPGSVQRDRLQSREPPDGGGGDLLLLRPREWEAHDVARRCAHHPRFDRRLLEDPVRHHRRPSVRHRQAPRDRRQLGESRCRSSRALTPPRSSTSKSRASRCSRPSRDHSPPRPPTWRSSNTPATTSRPATATTTSNGGSMSSSSISSRSRATAARAASPPGSCSR